MTDYTSTAAAFLIVILYALANYYDAVKTNKEQFDVISFAKTVILALLNAGLISQVQFTQYGAYVDIAAALGSSGGIIYVDNILNKFIGRLPALPQPLPPATTPKP